MRKNIEEYLEKRAKDIADEWVDSVWSITENFCESPIEQLFYIEFKYQIWESFENQPKDSPIYYIMPQHKITIGDNKYKVDFLIYYTTDDRWMIERDGQPEAHKDKSLIIELDSYLWHGSDPEQFAKEKQRERKLQKEGWKIMRFSGREIVRNVEKCIEQVIESFTEGRKN